MESSGVNCLKNEASDEPSRFRSPTFGLDFTDSGMTRTTESDHRSYSMSALEILRETVRILRFNSASFMAIAAVFICPVSALVLSNALVDQSIAKRLYFRLLLVARSCDLPLTPFLRQLCRRFADMALSATFCFPFFITLSLLSKAAIAYSVACTYAGKKVAASKFFEIAVKIWRRLISTYLWVCMVITGCLALFMVLLVAVCNTFAMLGFISDIIVYPAVAVGFVFSVVFAHAIIVCNLASVISVLEDVSGPQALLRSVVLIKGQTQVGLLIFLGSTIGMAFVEGLFEHRVKTLSYGDGSSRVWEGPLLVIMYSFVVLIDSMMSSVFYFTCRSLSIEFDSDRQTLVESNMVSSAVMDVQ